MLGRVKAWLRERHSKQAAVERALGTFRETRDAVPMGVFVLRHDPRQTIVRVMYMTDHIPPDRAWFVVSREDGEVRELSFDEVAHLESPWH